MKAFANLVCLFLAISCAVAQESAPSSTSSDSLPQKDVPPADAIQQKQAEVDRLQAELKAAQEQLKSIKDENTTLKTQNQQLEEKAVAPGPMPAPAPPPPALDASPDVGVASPVDSQALFYYFQHDAGGAAGHFKEKKIQVSGAVIGALPPILSHVFGLQLQSGDLNGRVVCHFKVPPAYSSVYYSRPAGGVVGLTSAGAEDLLVKLGSVVTVEGRCDGVEQGDVSLSNCRLLLP